MRIVEVHVSDQVREALSQVHTDGLDVEELLLLTGRKGNQDYFRIWAFRSRCRVVLLVLVLRLHEVLSSTTASAAPVCWVAPAALAAVSATAIVAVVATASVTLVAVSSSSAASPPEARLVEWLLFVRRVSREHFSKN